MKEERKIHTIDAQGKILGKLAAEVAIILRGKNKVGFAPHKDMGDFVFIENIQKMAFSGKKIDQKTYFEHSEYLGSGKHVPIKDVFKKDPCEVLRRAVLGMLPKNKLRAKMITRLRCKK